MIVFFFFFFLFFGLKNVISSWKKGEKIGYNISLEFNAVIIVILIERISIPPNLTIGKMISRWFQNTIRYPKLSYNKII